MKYISMVLAAALLATGVAGCMGTDPEDGEEKEENPAFSATFHDAPTWTYDSVVTVFTVDIKNVQPLKEGETVPEGGTHQVCIELDGEIPEARDGRPACELVGLAAGQEDRFYYRLAPLPVGLYDVTIRGAESVLEVRPTPTLGERLSGAYADVQVTADRNVTVWFDESQNLAAYNHPQNVEDETYTGGNIAVRVHIETRDGPNIESIEYDGTNPDSVTIPSGSSGSVTARVWYNDIESSDGWQEGDRFAWCCL